ncbi:MAG: hypothetical protein AMXMBFR7_34470 [Planctomycetota bacterium]
MTPLLFVGMIGALVALTLYFFATKAPILPPLISEHGQLIDDQIYLTLIITGAIFTIAQLGLAFLAYKYRHREGAKAEYLLGSHKLEYTWSAATLVLFVGLNLMGQKVWAEMHLNEHPKPAIEVEVTGLQFKWYIRYPGKDGVFGRRDVNLINDAEGNFLGLDKTDPKGADDIVMGSLTVPVGVPVVMKIGSRDVIHNFGVRELRVKQDAVPGLAVYIPFKATQTGSYEVACMELCGYGHYQMRSQLNVVTMAEYTKFLADNAP